MIVYREFEDGDLLYDMAWLMEHYKDEFYNTEDVKALLYECMHELLEMAGDLGFYGNLWHCYLTNLLVNNENSYSRACEIVGAIEGTINANPTISSFLSLIEIAYFKFKRGTLSFIALSITSSVRGTVPYSFAKERSMSLKHS